MPLLFDLTDEYMALWDYDNSF